MSKYKNKKVVVDGYNFDSKAEARYYQKLRDSGESFSSLSDEYWEMQKSIPVLPAYVLPSGRKIQAIKYKADFVKYRDGITGITRRVKAMRLIKLTEIYRAGEFLDRYLNVDEIETFREGKTDNYTMLSTKSNRRIFEFKETPEEIIQLIEQAKEI